MKTTELLAVIEPLVVPEAGGEGGERQGQRERHVGPITLPEELSRHLLPARELPRSTPAAMRQLERLPTALPDLDDLLAGGLARGRVVEIRGRRSCGRFSVVTSLLAASTAIGETVAFVDLGDHFDPQRATAAGVVTERLLWIRPTRLRAALSAAEILLAGSFPLVVLDLGLPPVPGGRGSSAGWLRLARAARRYQAMLLVSSPYRVSGSAAGEVLHAYGARPLWHGTGHAPRLLTGTSARIGLEKSRHGHRLTTADLTWHAGELVGPEAVARRTPQIGDQTVPQAAGGGSR